MKTRSIQKSPWLALLCMVALAGCSGAQFSGKDSTKGAAAPVATPVESQITPAPAGTGNLNQNAAPQAVPPASGNVWDPSQPITDIVTLEKCKWDILQKTGDTSVCMKCFNEWEKNGYKITAGECGCAPSSGLPTSGTSNASTSTASTSAPSTADLNAMFAQLKSAYDAYQKLNGGAASTTAPAATTGSSTPATGTTTAGSTN